MDSEKVVDALTLTTLLGPLIVSIGVALLGYFQYRVAKAQKEIAQAKLRADLFDRRYEVFLDVWQALSSVSVNDSVTAHGGFGTPFNKLRGKSLFLFGHDIDNYISEAHSKWVKLGGLIRGDDPKTAFDRAEIEGWFYEQANGAARARFEPYLSFKNWH
jgi:hypothetical protein